MSARARRAIACANRSSRSAHPPAQYPTCREARTGTSHACRTRTAQLALAAAAIRFRVAAMLPAATQAGTHLGRTHRQAGVPRKRPAGGQEAAAAPPSSSKAKATPTRRYERSGLSHRDDEICVVQTGAVLARRWQYLRRTGTAPMVPSGRTSSAFLNVRLQKTADYRLFS